MKAGRRGLYRVVVTPSRVTFVCLGCGKREESGQRGVKVGRGAGRVRVFTVYGHRCPSSGERSKIGKGSAAGAQKDSRT